MVVGYSVRGDSFVAERPRLWSEARLRVRSVGPILDLHPDGKHFVVVPPASKAGNGQQSVHLTFLLNYFDEVRRRVEGAK
jgi:eukaryotic-like serine/threonine-protein kinase